MQRDTHERDQKGFYVEPKRDCPHLAELSNDRHSWLRREKAQTLARNAPCVQCEHKEENWGCLHCGVKLCSRYISGHMALHNSQSGHPLCVSYSDFSFWCYSCESYVTHPCLQHLQGLLNAAKFGGRARATHKHAHLHQLDEYNEKPAELQEKIRQLARMVRNSGHLVVFTGAGISTSAGIPDYRGPQGVWTLEATGGRRTERTVPMLSALPTPGHMALVKLQDEGILKHLISQNVDGMHRKSGILPGNLSELHGNTNLEICERCGKEYLRDFSCAAKSSLAHDTGRICSIPGCNGQLKDSIINFGENLPYHVVTKAIQESNKSDVYICLGSSLTVTPAADMPKGVGQREGAKLVIVNLQKTPLDDFAALRIFSKCDEVMEGLMSELGLEIPPFILKRQVLVAHSAGRIRIAAVDVDGTPLSLFSRVEVSFAKSSKKHHIMANESSVAFHFDMEKGDDGNDDDQRAASITLHFVGHYNEPPLTIEYLAKGQKGSKKYQLRYKPSEEHWTYSEEEEDERGLIFGELLEEDLSSSSSSSSLGAHLPETIQHADHSQHELRLVGQVYQGVGFRCNKCLRIGHGPSYHCGPCQFDLHPTCALLNGRTNK